MLIKELDPTWPPIVGIDTIGAFAKADPADVVVSVGNGGSNNLIVNLRKENGYGKQYRVTLDIPENKLQQSLLSIIRNRGTTLLEIGEIKIA